jgi:hypothetical protein
MNFFDKIKDVEIWKVAVMIALLFVILIWSGYTVTTKWGSIYKNDPNEIVMKNLAKIKTQTNYSNDMKVNVLSDMSNLYQDKLLWYCKNKNIEISNDRVYSDVKYFKLIVVAINDFCEDTAMIRFIHDNDLYRYSNKADWENFKRGVADLFMRQGTQIVINYYDSSKVVMPIQDWVGIASAQLKTIIDNETDKFLEALKIESVIYHNAECGVK